MRISDWSSDVCSSDLQADYETTLDSLFLGSYHFVFNDRNPLVGGEENLALRQAISLSIDREDINTSVYNGSRTTSTGIVPEGIPGWTEGICEFCAYDLDAAKAKYQEWVEAGNTQARKSVVSGKSGSVR